MLAEQERRAEGADADVDCVALRLMPDMPPMASVGFDQTGMHSLGFKGQILGNQELRLRHFYQTLDRYLGASGSNQA